MQASNDNNPERVDKHRAALILGVPPRTVSEMAAKGALPGAAKIGRAWTFDVVQLRAHVRKREKLACLGSARRRTVATGVTGCSGHAARLADATNAGLYIQAIQRSLRNVAKK